ncbi:MAG: hypothetical protein ACP5O1_00570 [Phycisphaerae bacterium]
MDQKNPISDGANSLRIIAAMGAETLFCFMPLYPPENSTLRIIRQIDFRGKRGVYAACGRAGFQADGAQHGRHFAVRQVKRMISSRCFMRKGISSAWRYTIQTEK